MVYVKIIGVLLVYFALFNRGKTQIRLDSCSIQCGPGSETTLPGSATVTFQGPPGKRGPRGFKGTKGSKGSKGESAKQCNCDIISGLAEKIQKLQVELNKTKSNGVIKYGVRQIFNILSSPLMTENAVITPTYTLHLQTHFENTLVWRFTAIFVLLIPNQCKISLSPCKTLKSKLCADEVKADGSELVPMLRWWNKIVSFYGKQYMKLLWILIVNSIAANIKNISFYSTFDLVMSNFPEKNIIFQGIADSSQTITCDKCIV